MATSDSPLSVPDVTLTVARGASAPEPTGAPSISSVTDNGDDTITVSGSNFGSKSRPEPAFVDYCHEAYEVGAVNTSHGDNLAPGDTIGDIDDPTRLYIEGDTVTYETQGPKRHSSHIASYKTGASANTWFGRPKSFDWNSPNGRPNRPKYFQAHWFYFKDNPGYMWRVLVPQADLDAGNPIPGETVIVNGFPGVFGGVDDLDGYPYIDIHFDVSGPNNINYLLGYDITFQESGMVFPFPSEKGDAPPWNYYPAGFKFARVWDQGQRNDEYFGFSLASNDWYCLDNLSGGTSKIYNRTDLEGGSWHLSEFLIDLENGWAEWFLDGISPGRVTFNPITNYQNDSNFTMQMWGVNGKAGGTFNRMSTESCYCDDSLHRLLISTSPTSSDLRIDNTYHYEIQRPRAWTHDSIVFDLVAGALPEGAPLYLYVFNNENMCNSSGVDLGFTL